MPYGISILVLGALALKALWYAGIIFSIVWLMLHLNGRLRLKEDELALEKQRAVQFDEALELLRSINDNMANGTDKN